MDILRLRARWYAKPDNLIGGWCVMDIDATPGESSRSPVADFSSERMARHVAYLHNQWVKNDQRVAEVMSQCLSEGCGEDAEPVEGKRYGHYMKGDHVRVSIDGIIVKDNSASNYVKVTSGSGDFGLPYGDMITVHSERVMHI